MGLRVTRNTKKEGGMKKKGKRATSNNLEKEVYSGQTFLKKGGEFGNGFTSSEWGGERK